MDIKDWKNAINTNTKVSKDLDNVIADLKRHIEKLKQEEQEIN